MASDAKNVSPPRQRMGRTGEALVFVIDNLEIDRPTTRGNVKGVAPVGEPLQVPGRVVHQGFYGSARKKVGKLRAQELAQVRGQALFGFRSAQLVFFLLFLLPAAFSLGVLGFQASALFLESHPLSPDALKLAFDMCPILAGVGEAVLCNRRLERCPFVFEPALRLVLFLPRFFQHARSDLQVGV